MRHTMATASITLALIGSMGWAHTLAQAQTEIPLHTFVVQNAHPDYTFTLQAHCTAEACEGEATVLVHHNPTGKEQTLTTPDLNFYRETNNALPVNNIVMYGNQSAIVVQDFNFDGNIDIALRNGNQGPYGGPSYDVYVQTHKTHTFVLSDELTNLTLENLGMFGVDATRKRLIVWSKSGCCWHKTTHYKISPNKGLYEVYSLEENAMTANQDLVEVTTTQLINGKYRRRVKTYPLNTYYPE